MIPEWQIPIQMKFVRFAKEMLEKYPVDYVKEYDINDMKKRLVIDRSILATNNNEYMIPNISVKGFTVKDVKEANDKGHIYYQDRGAVFFYDNHYLVLHHSWYPVRFSVPKSCIIDYETQEKDIPQNITINEYAYKHCYMDRINRILENHGRNLFNLLQLEENDLRFRGSLYKDLIFKIQMDNIKKRWKKDEVETVMEKTEDIDSKMDRKESTETSIRTEAKLVISDNNDDNRKIAEVKKNKKGSHPTHKDENIKYKQYEWLHDQYINKKRTTVDIANECKVSDSTIGYWIKKLNIAIRDSSECQKGELGNNWKGGITTKHNRVYLHKPDHPNTESDGYIERSRFIMSEHLNRPLKKGEIVHHKDGNTMNDEIDNLELFNNRAEHTSYHRQYDVKYIFYTDGSGNLYNNKKVSNKGHYSILLKNTEEKWRRDEDKLTSNQAELKGVIGAFMIATKRGYQDVEIRTDSQAVINWTTGAWNAKNPNITKYVEILSNLVNKYPNIKIRKIPRNKNWAHPV